MIVQLSSGQGPAECELAVVKLYEALNKEYKIKLISKHEARTTGCCVSITFSTEEDLSELEGTVQWICESPFRPHHKRKNWFVDVSIIPEADEVPVFDEKDIRWERFHCGGNGGQNVNKVETGMRLIHIPTGIIITSTEERTQLHNKNKALKRLAAMLKEKEAENKAKQVNDAWREHNRIIRGNPVRVYKGMKFVQKKA
ncbi:peptide chain release factor [Lachnospiraceae bacterium]|nr:peptide chain release factor [Lachnospiraceae bacterium]